MKVKGQNHQYFDRYIQLNENGTYLKHTDTEGLKIKL